MSILGTLEGIGAGDPMGSFLKSNQAAIDQAGNAAAGKGLIALFNPQVPGAQPLSGPPPAGMPPNPTQPPQVPPLPPGGPQPYAQAGPQPAVPGAQPMPQGPPGPPQGPPGGGPMPGGPGPVAGAGQPNPQMQQAQQQNQQLKQQLAQLQAQRGGGGGQPQQPQPGQPPPGPPQGPGMQAPPQQPQVPPEMQAVAQGVQQNAGKLDWRGLVQSVVKANPGATPEVIMSAVNKLVPLMNANSLAEWRRMQDDYRNRSLEERTAHNVVGEGQRQEQIGQGQQRIDDLQTHRSVTEGQTDRRLNQADTRQENLQEHRKVTEGQGQQRIDLARTREGRLDRQGMARQDQRYAEMELKRKALENQAQRTKNGETLREWRQALEVQHQYTRTIIAGSQMSGKDKQKLLKDNDDWRNEQIKKMRENTEGTFDNKFQPAESLPPAMPNQ